MEDNISPNKSQSDPQIKKSSLNLKSKNKEQNGFSSTSKKSKQEEIPDEEDLTTKILSNLIYEDFESEQENLDEEDLTTKILSNLIYEDFESEQEKFFPHYRKKHEEIYINNVPLLDQNRFRFLISNDSKIFDEYTKYEKGNFKKLQNI